MSDIAALVAGNLDIWSSATQRKSGAGRGSGGKRISLYGIERLRALILDMAVRGKLVPQDAGDEKASRLLARIAVERKALQQAGKISKPKNLPPIDSDELNVPHTWVATRFGAVFSLEYGDNLPEPKRTGSGEYNVFGSNGVVGTHDSFTVDQPCLVVGRKGSAGAINKSQLPCWVTDVAYYCVPPIGIDLDFQYILFRTLGLDELGKGIKPGLNRNEANVLAVPLPPLAEQRRIVAKVDELMELCDALERESADAMAAHQVLVEELLGLLVNSADAADLAANWARLETHFDTLFTTDASIEALKQTILDLAVRGKLVEQAAGDEAASLTLARAVSAQSRMLENAKRKSRGDFEPSKSKFEEVSPSHWAWAYISDFAQVKGGKRIPKGKGFSAQKTDHVYIRVTDMERGTVNLENLVYIDAGVHDAISQYTINAADIYVTIAGTIGHVGTVPETLSGQHLTENAAKIVFSEIDQKFLLLVLNADDVQDQFADKTQAMAQPKLALKRIAGARVPIPPLAEQHRIVAKVDALMALCDQLKIRLADVAQTQRHLADAITERAAA